MGPAAFISPSSTATFAPGATFGASVHLVLDALMEIKDGFWAWESAQAVKDHNEPTTKQIGMAIDLSAFMFASFVQMYIV